MNPQMKSSRRPSELQVQESEQYQSLFQYHPDAIFSLDLTGNFQSINPATETITGFTREELLNKFFAPFIVPEDRERALFHFQKLVEGEPQNMEVAITHKSGRLIDVNVIGVPIIVNEKMVGVFGIMKDITERKRTEELLRKSDKLSALGQLAAGVAHEIRNPLTALKGFIQLLQSGTYKEEYSAIMLSELERIELIVDEFLVLAKPQVSNYQPHDIRILLNNIIALLDTQAILSNVQILTEFESDLPLVKCEDNQIKQVFINILKNAIEAMPDGGKIVIEMRTHGVNRILIRFIDEGHGIPPERIPKLGEPFYTTKEKGTGLGLMVTYKIIENHHGSISIESEINQGTIVNVFLPVN
ncbi:PAS domain-containing sensor histidine kinase [Effusibacillus consociatus]|uniref:histidine kinase n=1 Tax=Effusibacillus consociatus TaxID=1117041 RepID=A0ABV9Q8A3_9BACL